MIKFLLLAVLVVLCWPIAALAAAVWLLVATIKWSLILTAMVMKWLAKPPR